MDPAEVLEEKLFHQNNLDKILDQLVSVQTKLALSVEDIPRGILDPALDKNIDKLRMGFRELSDNLQSLIRPLIGFMKDDARRIAQLETNYGELYSKWMKEEKKRKDAEKEINQLKKLTAEQSNFCTNLGSVMGNLLWRSSKFPQLVNSWLKDNQTKVGEFLSIASTILISFIDTFSSSFPPLENDECQFIMAILGTITNISSTPAGRQYLISHYNGKEFVSELIQYIPSMPKPTGDSMKRLMLMILYNVSLNRNGLPFLMDLKIDETIATCLDESATQDIQLSSLRLLQSITYNLSDYSIFQRLVQVLPIDKIQHLASSMSDEQLSNVAHEIVDNLKSCLQYADTQSLVTSTTDQSVLDASIN